MPPKRDTKKTNKSSKANKPKNKAKVSGMFIHYYLLYYIQYNMPYAYLLSYTDKVERPRIKQGTIRNKYDKRRAHKKARQNNAKKARASKLSNN